MGGRLTASNYGRARACPASVALPQAQQPSSRDSTRGTAIHRFLQRAYTDGDAAAALAEVPEDAPWRETCESLDTNVFRRGAATVECEAAFAYDPLTQEARFLGYDLGRNYHLRGAEIPGAADLVVTYEDGGVLIVDWKTGFKSAGTAASDQLHLLALMVATARGHRSVRVAIVRVREDGTTNVREPGADFDDEEEDDAPSVWGEITLGEADLARVALEARQTVRRIDDAAGQIARGFAPDTAAKAGRCDHCPAIPSCPVYTKLARHMLQADQVEELISSLTPETAGILWERVQRQEQILKLVKGGLQAFADRQPILLPDGRTVVVPTQVPREVIDAETAFEAVADALGLDAAQGITKPSITKKSIEQYARGRTESAAGARDLKKHILEIMRAAGAVTFKPSTQYKTRERLESDFVPEAPALAPAPQSLTQEAPHAERETQPSLFGQGAPEAVAA